MAAESGLVVRLAALRARIEVAAHNVGRDPESIRLIAITKGHPVQTIRQCLEVGVADIGENRVQELATKATTLGPLGAAAETPRWHFVGQIQRNKVAAAAGLVTMWHGLDREAVAVEIARRAPGAAVLVQMKLGEEVTKGGAAPADIPRLVRQCRDLGLNVLGLTGVAPLGVDPQPHFAALRALADSEQLTDCSMGMSGDFEAAIAEGSTMIRIGTALVGPRPL